MSADTREKLLAWIDEKLAVCEKATKGPWVSTVRPNDRQGSAHYTVENPTFDGPCDCGGKHPPGKLIAWPAGGLGDASIVARDATRARHDPSTEADAIFMASSRTLLPLVLSALRVEVALHEEMGGPDGSCNYCGEDGHGVPEDWPCPFLRRLASALLGESS
jgi:hypothetical protein